MKDARFEWPSADVIGPARHPGLPKAIANTFMQNFFKAHGTQLACLEARHVVEVVTFSVCFVSFL